jgi:uncharacterized membrane protein YeaQ/YmgE (transglycosylase-associated protein family)
VVRELVVGLLSGVQNCATVDTMWSLADALAGILGAYLAKWLISLYYLERAKGFEPSTPTLARL